MPLFPNVNVLPGVYVKTIRQLSTAVLPGTIRFPVLIGEGDENVTVSNYPQIRGSSNSVDNFAKNEVVTDRFLDQNDLLISPDGVARRFQTKNVPIVTGDGSGTPTTDPVDVSVTINGNPAGVLKVEGEEGIVHLAQLTLPGDEVIVSYYYDKRDTQISGEDLSFQIDGLKDTFKVKFPRVVDGSHGGVTTTDPEDITVRVNGAAVTVNSLNGTSGVFTLAAIPAGGSTLTVDYFTNNYEDTADPFPEVGIEQINFVGNNPDKSDFTNTVDYVLVNDHISWGSAAYAQIGNNTPGSEVFNEQDITLTLVDNRRFMDQATGTSDGINKSFVVASVVADGTGRARPSDDPAKIVAYVGTDPQDARSNGPVTVDELYGATRTVVLHNAPAVGQNVYVTYWYSILTDASYEVVNKLAGTVGVGEYMIDSPSFGPLATVAEGTHVVQAPNAANFAIEGIVFPDAFSDLQATPGIAVNETVTLTFTDAYNYTVTSNVGNGSAGTGTLEQTYIDGGTGLRFTILDPNLHTFVNNPYDFQAGDVLEFVVSVGANFLTSAVDNIQIPGLRMILSTTDGVAVDDSLEILSFNKSGKEPAVGSQYFITYEFEKPPEGYETIPLSNVNQVPLVVGTVNLNNRLSLGMRICFRNGAVFAGAKQVKRAPGSPQASAETYIQAIDDLKTRMEGERNQDVIVPLTNDLDVFGFLKDHVETQSNVYNGNRRIGIVGLLNGTAPTEAVNIANSLNSERMWVMYPDGGVISYQDEIGREIEGTVDGSFLGAALAGRICSNGFDPAVPIMSLTLNDFKRLYRRLDSVTAADMLARGGLIYVQDVGTTLRIKDALTSNIQDVLLAEPNVTLIDDSIASAGKRALEIFVGKKSLDGIEKDIESRIAGVMQAYQRQNIIRAFRDITAEIDADDSRVARVSVAYVPVFPLKWLLLTLNVTTSLG